MAISADFVRAISSCGSEPRRQAARLSWTAPNEPLAWRAALPLDSAWPCEPSRGERPLDSAWPWPSAARSEVQPAALRACESLLGDAPPACGGWTAVVRGDHGTCARHAVAEEAVEEEARHQ